MKEKGLKQPHFTHAPSCIHKEPGETAITSTPNISLVNEYSLSIQSMPRSRTKIHVISQVEAKMSCAN